MGKKSKKNTGIPKMENPPPPPKVGRPRLMTDEVFEKICYLISTSTHGLRRICKENEDLPDFKVVFYWLNKVENKLFLERYARAKENQADILADEIQEIADDSANDSMQDERGRTVENREWINRSRLRVDARKWVAAHLKPKKYGDKLDLTSGGEKVTAPIIINWSGQSNEKKDELK